MEVRHEPETIGKNEKRKRFYCGAGSERWEHTESIAVIRCRGKRLFNDEEMFNLVHEMRTRIITSPSFTSDRVLAAILFENTMDRKIEDKFTADYLWDVKGIIPILKIDKGLADLDDGVQLMKPIPGLDKTLARARDERHIFGTKMRSVIKEASESGIKKIVDQQFEIGLQIAAAGLVPIIEPEVDIHCPDKAKAEEILKKILWNIWPNCRKIPS